MEPQKNNDLFFTCSLIEYIARKTKNTKKEVVEKLGKETINKIYSLAEVYHSENIEKVAEEFIEKAQIKNGDYDVTQNCEYRIPSFWELGRIYQRLIVVCIMKVQNICMRVMKRGKFYKQLTFSPKRDKIPMSKK